MFLKRGSCSFNERPCWHEAEWIMRVFSEMKSLKQIFVVLFQISSYIYIYIQSGSIFEEMSTMYLQ